MLTGATEHYITGGHIALLGTCPELQQLILLYDLDPNRLWWWDMYITIWGQALGYAHEEAEAVNLS